MSPSRSRIIQVLFDRLLSAKSPIEWNVLFKLRQIVIRYYDPLVNYAIAGTDLVLPLSHQLPLFRRSYPHYSANVARIAKAVNQKYPDMTFVDVGANVGDTVAISREMTHFPILCIEGDKGFFDLLKRNVGKFNDVYAENHFASVGKPLQGRLEKRHGTAHFVQDARHEIANSQTLSEILSRYDEFARRMKMIKVDTDGFDIPILCSERDLLSELKPVIFFEYDPHFAVGHQPDEGSQIFDMFEEIGYSTAIFYDNFGDYLLATSLSGKSLLEDLHQYVCGRGGLRYFDIALFATQDRDLADVVRNAERDFFRAYRNLQTS